MQTLQPAFVLSDAEHHACMLHSALCQLQHGLGLLPQLMPHLTRHLLQLQWRLRAAAPRAYAAQVAARCGALLAPLASLLLGRLSCLVQLCEEEQQHGQSPPLAVPDTRLLSVPLVVMGGSTLSGGRVGHQSPGRYPGCSR